MADDKEKSNEACSKGLSEILEEDRISQLPDPLICHILSHLPIKDSVKTSVLSTRWKTLWLWVSRLELKSGDFSGVNAAASFGDKFFDSDRVSCIHNFHITIDQYKDRSSIISWIDAAVKRKVQHLFVRFSLSQYHETPVSIYMCDTLVSLDLHCVTLDYIDFVSFPRLKTMDLTCASLPTFERLVSCCPVLEDLYIYGCVNLPRALRVYSPSLKTFHIVGCFYGQGDSLPGVVIDAPLLRYLKINDYESNSFIVNNLEYNATLQVNPAFGIKFPNEANVSSRRSLIRSFLSGISKVEELTISAHFYEIIYNYSKLELLPQFGYTSRLCVVLYEHYWKWLEPFLESCTNLKSLVLVRRPLLPLEKMDQVNIISSAPSSVPKCLQSSLEFVELEFLVLGDVAEMKLMRYFLEHSAVLKRLILHLGYDVTKDEILKKLLEIPRASTKCEVVILEFDK